MKKKIFVVALAFFLVFGLSACKNKNQGNNGGNGTVGQKYSFNFSLAGDIPAGQEDAFVTALKKRMSVFGYPDATVTLTAVNAFKVEFAPVPGIIFIDSDYKQYMLNTPTFEIRTRQAADKLVLTAEETRQMTEANAAARVKAEDLLQLVLADPAKFAELAKANSEDPGSKDNGGAYTGIKKGVFVPEYENVIFGDLAVGAIYPRVVETQFGYHIIKKDAERGSDADADREIDTSHILISKQTEQQILAPREWLETGLDGMYINLVNPVKQSEESFAFQILFNEAGAARLAELTKANVGKPLAIFIDGIGIGAPTVENEITNGELVITGNFTQDSVIQVAQRLSSGAIHAPVRLVE